MKKRHKRKRQFSKCVCIFGLVLISIWLAGVFLLAWFDKNPLDATTNIIVMTFGGFATGGYYALAGVRDCSKNRNNFHQNNPSGVVNNETEESSNEN
ncbi:hypothetical protein FACS1894208_09280 [Clostridia bacterium]|nr:hypothetical protein FACS1894208_09280 [Clostridia bacterium]